MDLTARAAAGAEAFLDHGSVAGEQQREILRSKPLAGKFFSCLRRTTATAAKFPALLSSLQTVARSVQVLPGTVTRVETHVSHRKQTAA
ncbi:MAG TPA: hypothetical protein VNK23_03635, partial [Candidatus Dormibacteraeota bacterium]|nr:hypothetical protein [Candidatus Dormibacteraeota bacterium]